MYFILNGIAFVISRLPNFALVGLGHVLAFVFFSVLRIRRKLILKNLNTAFGDKFSTKEKISIGYKSTFNFVMTILEFFSMPHGGLADGVSFEGSEIIETALKEGRGAYVLCMHMGSWEAQGAAYTKRFCNTYVIVKKVGSDAVYSFVKKIRKNNGFLEIVRQKKGDALLQIKSALSANEIIGFAFDQARPGEPRLPFFGKPALTNTSLAAIHQRFPAPIIPAYIIRNGVHKHTAYTLPALELPLSGDLQKDILVHSQIFNDVVASCITKHPEHYFWMHNRWKD